MRPIRTAIFLLPWIVGTQAGAVEAAACGRQSGADDFEVCGHQALHPSVRLRSGDGADATADLLAVLGDDLRFGDHVAPVDESVQDDELRPALEVRTTRTGTRLACEATFLRPSGVPWKIERLQGPADAGRRIAHQLAVDVVNILVGINDTTPLTTLYFLRDAGDHRDLWAMDADGARPRLALSDFVWSIDPVLSPGTDGIAFVRTFQGLMQSWGFWPGSGRLAALAPALTGAQLGATLVPGGGAIVVEMDATGKTRLLRVGARGVTALTTPNTGDLTPSLTSDGRSVLFASERSGGSQIFQVGLDGQNLVRLTTTAGFFLSPRALPDGDVALVARAQGHYDIAVWHAHGGDVELLTHGEGDNLDPVPLGPDHLVFSSDRNGRRRLYVMGMDGSNVAELPLSGPGGACESVECSAPVWQPAPPGVPVAGAR